MAIEVSKGVWSESSLFKAWRKDIIADRVKFILEDLENTCLYGREVDTDNTAEAIVAAFYLGFSHAGSCSNDCKCEE